MACAFAEVASGQELHRLVLALRALGHDETSAAVRFCCQDHADIDAVLLEGEDTAVPELAEGASPEAISCCDCAPPPHQTISDLIYRVS